MAESRSNKYWTLIIVLLIALIALGGISAWSRYSHSQPIEIAEPLAPQVKGDVYISGAVRTPGFYPARAGDSLEALIQAAGGTTGSANPTVIELYVPEAGGESQPQKININRAGRWLLEALPGIGETRAQDIIDHRNRNGDFHNINELVEVEGIGVTIYERIKPLITVSD